MTRTFVYLLPLILTTSVFGGDDASLALGNVSEMRAFFSDLLKQGGWGFRHTESAAFVVINETGHYRCIAWPFRPSYERQEIRGPMPPFTVAIAHTHPKSAPRPSANDASAAAKLRVPVYVLTPSNIYVATADGTVLAVVEKREWWRGAASGEGCSVQEGRRNRHHDRGER